MITLLLSLTASAVPLQLQHQGRLFDSAGAPYQGTQSVTIRLYNDATGGSVLWEDTDDIEFDGGYFVAAIGSDTLNNPLQPSQIDHPSVYVSVEVDGVETDRQRVMSVPYAVLADNATNLSGGVVDASEIRVDGTTVIDGSGSFVGTGVDTLAELSCSFGQVALYSGTDWICGDMSGGGSTGPIDWSDVINVPLDLVDGDDDLLAATVCGDDQVLVWSTSFASWGCIDRVDESEIEGLITNGSLDLAAGTTIGGATPVSDWTNLPGIPADLSDGSIDWAELTSIPADLADGSIDWAELTSIPVDLADGSIDWAELTSIPADIADGDDDTQLTEAEVDAFVANNGFALSSGLAAIATTGGWADLQGVPAGFADGTDDDTQLDEAAVDAMVANNGYLAAADFAPTIVDRDDGRITYTPAVFDCSAGGWCDASPGWGQNRFSTNAYYTECQANTDCSAAYLDLTLANNAHRSVLLSHLDWSNTGVISVFLSADGGGSFTFHKAIDTYRQVNETPYTSTIRTVASNLPQGVDVVVRLVASKGRMHFEGFALSNQIFPEEISDGYERPTIAYGKGADGTCDNNGACGPSPLGARQLTFVKVRDETRLKVEWDDVTRSYGNDNTTTRACRYYIRFNGSACPGGDLHWDVYGARGTDPHQPSSMAGSCTGLAAGTYTVQAYVSNTPGYGQGRCYTGWASSNFKLEVQETR